MFDSQSKPFAIAPKFPENFSTSELNAPLAIENLAVRNYCDNCGFLVTILNILLLL